MVIFMQWTQELRLNSGGPKNAVQKKKEEKENTGKIYTVYSVPILFQFKKKKLVCNALL